MADPRHNPSLILTSLAGLAAAGLLLATATSAGAQAPPARPAAKISQSDVPDNMLSRRRGHSAGDRGARLRQSDVPNNMLGPRRGAPAGGGHRPASQRPAKRP